MFFQKEGVKIIKTVKSSNLPSNIKNDSIHLAGADKSAKLSNGPTFPKPGPIFPKQVATAPIEVLKSNPKEEIRMEPIANTMK